MNKDWINLFRVIQHHLGSCSFGSVSIVFDIHAGSIAKIHIQHDERYMDISEVPNVLEE